MKPSRQNSLEIILLASSFETAFRYASALSEYQVYVTTSAANMKIGKKHCTQVRLSIDGPGQLEDIHRYLALHTHTKPKIRIFIPHTMTGDQHHDQGTTVSAPA